MPKPPLRDAPPPPEAPLPDDCCGSGCPRCVHDLYEEQLAEWRRRWQPDPERAPDTSAAPGGSH